MKKIISFAMPKELCKDCIVTKCRKMLKDKTQCYLNRKPYGLVENKVPETFEELKELCKDLKGLYKNYNIEVFDDAIFVLDAKAVLLKVYDDGEIKDSGSEVIAENRTPQQMWNIIKNLIGEEK